MAACLVALPCLALLCLLVRPHDAGLLILIKIMPFYAPLCESSSDYAITQRPEKSRAQCPVSRTMNSHSSFSILSFPHSRTVCLTNGAEVHHQLLRLMDINFLCCASAFFRGPVVARAAAERVKVFKRLKRRCCQ